ncbi:MAG: MFS transporter, partial [Candidatus Rokuibacteriota bacterium]
MPRVRLPFYYGWLLVATAFVTMGIGVNARTAFSLFFPPILNEFGWDRGVTAGAFSFGFLVSAAFSPLLGRLVDRRGPRLMVETGVGLVGIGLLLATLVSRPWHLYLTLGVLVGGGSVCLAYTGHALFLPQWFVRRRGLAVSIAFSGVGVGSIVLLPWVQVIIASGGWRHACVVFAIVVLVVLAPLNLVLRRRPEDLGLLPDGDTAPRDPRPGAQPENVVDPVWVAVDWTLPRALRTTRFWWVVVAYFCGL